MSVSNDSISHIIENACICIPARYNSSRLPGKLMYLLDDKTCIQRTVNQCLHTGLDIYVLTDHHIIYDHIISTFISKKVTVILADQPCINGTERISMNLDKIPNKFSIIVNVQADEPFISHKNIMHAINMYLNVNTGVDKNELHFYTTLHETILPDTPEKVSYLQSTSSLTLETSLSNRVLTYSRNIIPWNKNGSIDQNYEYKLFTGIYVFNRKLLTGFHNLPNTKLQQIEDIEQLKVLEHDYNIYSFPTIEYNEISLNDLNDLKLLCMKHNIIYKW